MIKKIICTLTIVGIIGCAAVYVNHRKCNNPQKPTFSNTLQSPPIQAQTNSTEKKLLEEKLFEAIAIDDKPAVKQLIAQGVNINAYDEENRHTAVEAAGKKLFEGGGTLTQSPAADLYEALTNTTPQETILWYLIEAGASLDKCEWLVRNIVESGNISFVKLLIKKGIDLSKYKGILLDAANGGDEEVFKLILSKSPDINYQNEHGNTALLMALTRDYDAANDRNEAIIKTLLELGADVNHKNIYGGSALAFAMEDASIAIVKLLLQNKANLHESKILMHLAVQAGQDRKEKVKFLLKQGLSLEEKDDKGQTPLHWAVGSQAQAWRHNSDLDTTKILLERGANVNATDKNGRTPLINHILTAEAIDAERIKNIILVLLKFGADPLIKDNDGKNAEDYLLELMKNDEEHKFTAAYELLKKN